MTALSSLLIDVGDLLANPGRRRTEHVVVPVPFGVEMSRTDPEQPLRADVELEGVTGGVLAGGSVITPVIHTCNRCLLEWRGETSVQFRELFTAGEGGDYLVEGDHIDLEPLLRDEIVLALPVAPLCRPDCQGLCSTCGADLNTGSCACPDVEHESPFAGLRHLLESE